MIKDFACKNPKAMGYALVTLVSPVADLTCDIKKEVKAAAVDCMSAICNCTGNKDLEPFLPSVVEAAQSISNTHSCVEKLAGCIFVQNVETSALAATLRTWPLCWPRTPAPAVPCRHSSGPKRTPA